MILSLLFEHPREYLTIVFLVIGSIVLHELGHALAASWEGDATPKIRGHLTWNPVVHMGWLALAAVALVGIGWGQTPVTRSRFRHRRWGDVIVSFAGPAVHVLLALLAATMVVVAGSALPSDDDGARYVRWFWGVLLEYNVVLFLFNMIPVPPFDGLHVFEGFIDFGEIGAAMRRTHPLAFIIVWVLCANGVIPLWQLGQAGGDFLVKVIGGAGGF